MQSQYPVVEAVLIATRAMSDSSFLETKYYRRSIFCARSVGNSGRVCLSSRSQLRKPVRPANVFAQFRPKCHRHGEKHLDNPWIELGARALLNFRFGLYNRQRPPVGAVGDHGVERVRDREYPRPERNFISAQSTR